MQRTQKNITSIAIQCYHRLWQPNEIKGMLKNYLLEKNCLIDCKHRRQKNEREIPGQKTQQPLSLTADGNSKIWPEVQICHWTVSLLIACHLCLLLLHLCDTSVIRLHCPCVHPVPNGTHFLIPSCFPGFPLFFSPIAKPNNPLFHITIVIFSITKC